MLALAVAAKQSWRWGKDPRSPKIESGRILDGDAAHVLPVSLTNAFSIQSPRKGRVVK